MKYDDHDALDAALFNLPLEEPPADLRASILATTAYRPQSAFAPWEAVLVGGAAAVILWLIVLLAMGGGPLFVHTFSAIGSGATRALSNVSTLAWLAAGAATAYWLVLFTGSQPFVLASQRSGRRSSR
jgi:hypothetical protein